MDKHTIHWKKTVTHTNKNRAVVDRLIERQGILTSPIYKQNYEEAQKQLKLTEVKEYLCRVDSSARISE